MDQELKVLRAKVLFFGVYAKNEGSDDNPSWSAHWVDVPDVAPDWSKKYTYGAFEDEASTLRSVLKCITT